jgi:hypothetical protein
MRVMCWKAGMPKRGRPLAEDENVFAVKKDLQLMKEWEILS